MDKFAISEDAFRRQIRDYARLNGWRLQYHTYDSRRSDPGFPDEVFVNPEKRRVLFIEFKSEKGRVSKAQDQWLKALWACGMEVAVWRPSDMDFIRRVLGKEQLSIADSYEVAQKEALEFHNHFRPVIPKDIKFADLWAQD